MSLTIEHAEHVTIRIADAQSPEAAAFLREVLPASSAIAVSPPQADPQPPELGQVWPGQGGIYVGILPAIGNRPAMHLIAGPECADRLKWGPYEDETPATSRHDGRANTQALVASRDKYPAAWWCSNQQVDGHADWHLPSQAELFMALLYAPQAFEKESWYWSSTQDSRTYAFVQDFAYGYSGWRAKGLELRVRAFRWIHLNA